MKQTLFMIVVTAIGTLGVFVAGPFAGVAVYYLFAVLRPQFLWEWALPPGIGWSMFVALAAILGAMGMGLGLLPGGEPEKPFRGFARTHRTMLLFAVWVCLSYITAQNHTVAGFWLVEYLKIFTMFVVAALVLRTTGQVRVVYLLATLALIYIAYEVNVLYLFDHRLDIYHNGYGGLDNNGAGLMLAIGVPLAIYAWEGTQEWWRWIFILAVPGMIHAVLMTYSRGAMVSLAAVAPLALLRSRKRLQFAGAAVAIALIVPVLAGKEIRSRFFSVEQYDSDQSAESRFASWQAAIRIANAYPVFGVGIRNSNLLSHRYGADMEGRTIHSQYLQILADSGYPALLFYLLTIVSFWIDLHGVRRRLRGRDSPDARMVRSLASGLECGMAVFCVGGAFLSLEVFELPYLVLLLGGQLKVLVEAIAAPPGRVGAGATVEAGVTSS